MNELVKLVAEKAGIPEKTAKVAVDTVLKFLKAKLPAPIAKNIDGILAGKVDANSLGTAAKGLSGLLKKK